MRTSITIAITAAATVGLAGCLYPPIPEPYYAYDVVDESDGEGDMDAGGISDEGPLASVPILNSCRPENYVDRTADGAQRVVSFGGANSSFTFGYVPRCMLVAAGQTVQFRGEFSGHPLSPGIGQRDTTAGSPNNPIPPTSSGTQLDVRFDTAGSYPFFCMIHVSTGMSGVITVR